MMLENLDLQKLQDMALDWGQTHLWTLDSAVQFGIIVAAFVAGFIGQRLMAPRLVDQINKMTLSYRVSEVLRSLTRLVMPFITLVVVFVAAQVVGSETVGIDVTFSKVVMKLLATWIFIRLLVQLIQNRFSRNVVSLTVWVIAALSIFGVLDEATTALDAAGVDLGEFRFSALTVIKGIISLFALLYIASLLSKVLDRQLRKASSLTPSSRVLISKITRVFLVISALLIGVTTAGIDLSLLAVFSGAVGLGVGFGLQKGISNLFSGMLLLLDQSIKPGDIIEMEGTGTFGWVNHMGARYTELVTRDNKSFLVPNEDFITQKVINWSHGDTLIRIETKFGVHYESDPHEVKRLAEAAAGAPDRVVEDPAPVCHLVEFGDSSLNFVLRFWIRDAEKGVTNMRGGVMLALWDTFKENGIKIPYPHREVFIHDAPKTKAVSKPTTKKKTA